MPNEWVEENKTATPEYTQKGYGKRLTYEKLVKIVVVACNRIRLETIKKAFESCGSASNGDKRVIDMLYNKLSAILCVRTSTIKRMRQKKTIKGNLHEVAMRI
jgi:hypothetical protein